MGEIDPPIKRESGDWGPLPQARSQTKGEREGLGRYTCLASRKGRIQEMGGGGGRGVACCGG